MAYSQKHNSETTELEHSGKDVIQDLTSNPIRIRHCVVLLACIGMVIMHAMRTNLAFVVITILHEVEHLTDNSVESGMKQLPDITWDSIMVGYLHSSFYIGYLLTHIPAGYLTIVLPSHRIFGGCIFLSCLLNLLLPVCIHSNQYVLTFSVRFIQGMVEGSLYPACYGILRHWSTSSERGRAGSACLAGAYAGAVVGFPMAGVITHYVGWHYIFYLNGAVGILFAAVWMWFSSEKPSDHDTISSIELEFLQKEQYHEILHDKSYKIPVKDILTSPAVLSLCICHFARNWVFILMLTNEPFYLSLFKFTVAEIGLYSSIPHIVKVIAAASSGYIADYLMIDAYFTTGDVRKLLTGIGFGTSCLAFFLLTFVHDSTMVLVFLTLAVGFTGFPVSGWQINHYDLSAHHASFLVGISSTVGNIGSVTVPIITGYITVSHNTLSWNIVYYTTACVLGVAVISYLIFGSGQQQPWANPHQDVIVIQKMDTLSETKPYTAEHVQDRVTSVSSEKKET